MYRDDFRSVGLVFVETHPLLNLDFSRTNRKELHLTFDVVFRFVLHEQKSDHKTGFFESIAVSENFL